jgi:ferrous iron transport protein A
MKPYAYRPLPTIAPGHWVKVMTIAAGQRASRRLKDMGIVPGATLRVVRSGGNGAMILGIGDSRLAIERGIAHKVLVQLTPQPAALPEQETESDPSSYGNTQEVTSWLIA